MGSRHRTPKADLDLVADVGVVDLEGVKPAGPGQLEDGDVQLPDVPVRGLHLLRSVVNGRRLDRITH
jgi:hypothetical protein